MYRLKNISLAIVACMLCTQAQAIELVKSGVTTFSVGGYVKAEGIFASPDKGDSNFKGNARESRINFTTTTLVDDKKIKGFIEGDFYGDYASGGSNLRLRHAYMQVDNVTVGKTWSGQFFAVAPRLTEQFDFWGTGFGTIAGSGMYARPDLTLHYAKNGLRLTAQDPVYEDTDLPDMVISYSDDLSNLGYTLAVTAREAGTDVGSDLDSDLGLGVSLAGKLKLGEGSLHGSVYTGKGMGVYSGVCTTGTLTPVSVNCDAEDGELVSQTGFSVGYQHKLTPKIRGNMRYGEVNVNDSSDTSIDIKSINLIYTYLPNLDLGVEWRDRSDTTLPWRQAGQEVEVMAKYTF